MADETVTTKIRTESKRRLRVIAKSSGLQILDVLDRLIGHEYERLKKKGVIVEKGSEEE